MSQKSSTLKSIVLIPDSAILAQARIKAGQYGARMGEIANLILQDPVLSLEFLHSANSVLYAGASVTSVQPAITRLGTEDLISTLAGLNSDKEFESDDLAEMFEVLRFNCRRTSIVALIVGTVLRPKMTELIRTSSLFCDIGHMVALLKLGDKYLETAAGANRKNLPYRLEKDHKLDVHKVLVDYLEAKGMPERLVLPFDQTKEARESVDVDLRCCVQGALELVDAYDAEKLHKYLPEETLPSRSSFRMLAITPIQQERIFLACKQYLKQVHAEEAPEGASFLVTSYEEDQEVKNETTLGEGAQSITIPTSPTPDVSAKSKTRLQGFFELCEQEKDREKLYEQAVSYLPEKGLYNRAAIIRVSADGKEAFISHVVGDGLSTGTPIDMGDELSPFRHFRVNIKSCPTKNAPSSTPFGCSAYAIGPITVEDNGDRTLLYIDNTDATVLTMESRRVFRLLLGLLRK